MMHAPARKSPDLTRYSGRFADRLRKLREKAGLLPEDFAKTLGVSLSAVYRWEGGSNQPDPDMLPKIAEVLNLNNVRMLFPLK